jgi:hypothetical protein
MEYCQQEIEKFDLETELMANEKLKFKKQRRNRSFVSLENLDAGGVTVTVESEE